MALEIAKSRNKKQEKKELIPLVCEIPDCEYDIVVTRHRIRPGKSGGKYIPGNVIGLCPNHHAAAELGLIPKGVMFAIIQKRLGKSNNGQTKTRFRNGTGVVPSQAPCEKSSARSGPR